MYSEFAMVSLLVVIGRQVISSCDVVAISDAVNDIYIPVISTHITVKVYSDLKYCTSVDGYLRKDVFQGLCS